MHIHCIYTLIHLTVNKFSSSAALFSHWTRCVSKLITKCFPRYLVLLKYVMPRRCKHTRWASHTYIHPQCHITSLPDEACSATLCNESCFWALKLEHKCSNPRRQYIIFPHVHPGQGQESCSCVAKALNLWWGSHERRDFSVKHSCSNNAGCSCWGL